MGRKLMFCEAKSKQDVMSSRRDPVKEEQISLLQCPKNNPGHCIPRERFCGASLMAQPSHVCHKDTSLTCSPDRGLTAMSKDTGGREESRQASGMIHTDDDPRAHNKILSGDRLAAVFVA